MKRDVQDMELGRRGMASVSPRRAKPMLAQDKAAAELQRLERIMWDSRTPPDVRARAVAYLDRWVTGED